MITDHSHRRFDLATLPVGVDPDACAYLNCRRPADEHERGRAERQTIDWARFRKCEDCGAALGERCRTLSGWVKGKPVYEYAAKPHGGRELRAGYAHA